MQEGESEMMIRAGLIVSCKQEKLGKEDKYNINFLEIR